MLAWGGEKPLGAGVTGDESIREEPAAGLGVSKGYPIRGWGSWGLYGLIWVILALLGAAEAYLGFMVAEKSVPLWGLIRRQLESWGAWGLVGIGVVGYAQWLRARAIGRGGWILAHMLGGFVASVIYSAIYSALVHGQPSIQEPVILQFQTAFPITLIHSSALGLLVYWLVVAGYHGLSVHSRLQLREREAVELERLLTQSRLDSLRAQLHPHFLFNTLHTVSSLIHSKPDLADRVVVRLSELLRASLDQGARHEIPLGRELAFLDRYLEIEQARFGDRLRVERAVDPGALELMVPTLILQPLVENAVRHGIERRGQGGRLMIVARVGEGALELTVRDNGPGLGVDATHPGRERIGLSNTRARLQQLYGKAHRFELNVPEDGGLEVRLILPIRHAHAHAHHDVQ